MAAYPPEGVDYLVDTPKTKDNVSYDPSPPRAQKSVTGSKHQSQEETKPNTPECEFHDSKLIEGQGTGCQGDPLFPERGNIPKQVVLPLVDGCLPALPHEGTPSRDGQRPSAQLTGPITDPQTKTTSVQNTIGADPIAQKQDIPDRPAEEVMSFPRTQD